MPWEDLRYLFGEIMYGGHITDDWDRRLCRTYLEEYMNADVIAGWLNYRSKRRAIELFLRGEYNTLRRFLSVNM